MLMVITYKAANGKPYRNIGSRGAHPRPTKGNNRREDGEGKVEKGHRRLWAVTKPASVSAISVPFGCHFLDVS